MQKEDDWLKSTIHLLTSCKQRQNMHPGGIRKALKQLCDLVEDLFFGNELQQTHHLSDF